MSFFTKSRPRDQARCAIARGVVSCVLILWGVSTADHAESRELVIGRVSTEPQRAVARVEKLADYLSANLADLGVTKGRAMVVSTDNEMIRLLRSGEVDLLSETVVAAISYVDEAGAEVLLHEWRDHVPYYHALFIVRKDSDLHELRDLAGRRVAFERPGSTSAYLVPFAMLRQIGLEPLPLSGFEQRPPSKRPGYLFSVAEVNTASWVVRGLVDAGSVSDIDWNNSDHIPDAIKKDLRVLATSLPLIRSLLLARKGLDPILKKRVVDVLAAADRDPSAQGMMHDYFDVDRYTRIEGEMANRLEDTRFLVYSGGLRVK